MAGAGHVTTARGDSLDMEDLKRKANKRPLTTAEKAAMKDEIPVKKKPRVPINVRGNMPRSGVEKAPEFKKKPTPNEPLLMDTSKSPGKANPEGLSMSDLTGIKVDKPKKLEGPVEDIQEHADGALGDIMQELETNAPHARDAAEVAETEKTPDEMEAIAKKRPTRRKS